MKQREKGIASNIIIFVFVLVAIVILMRIIYKATQVAGKYDTFAQCLVQNGVKFYGAFWCPHCQEQERWLDATRQKLQSEKLYTECSTSDAKGQTPACIAEKIESYPSWTFKNGIKIASADAPIVCEVSPGKDGQDPKCEKNYSQFFKRWIFSDGVAVASDTEPTISGGTWSFPPSAQTRGELPLSTLSTLSGCVLNTPTSATK